MSIYIDDEKKPRLPRDRAREKYQGGRSSFWLSNPYSLPLFSEPKIEGLRDIFGQVNVSTTEYSFWPGEISFKKEYLHQHGTWSLKRYSGELLIGCILLFYSIMNYKSI